VDLPGGVVKSDGRPERVAALRPLSGFEEDWLAANTDVPSALAVTRLLSACLLRIGDQATTPGLVRTLLVGDRDFLMLQLRRLTLGERFAAVLGCPECGARMDVDFGVADVPVEPRPQETADYALELGGRRVHFRLPNGGDQEAVIGDGLEEAVATLLDRCLIDDGGRSLSRAERAEVIEAQDRLAPQVDLELEPTCPECGRAFVAPFDTTAFFLHEMRAGALDLLREFHLLAFHYHWSEAEILALRRDRRRAYLSLVRDTLRGE
jgi:hypothetical protein